MPSYDPSRLFPSARARHVVAGNTSLYCVEAGAGRPVVLVGGWPQSVHVWRHVFAQLAKQYHVIAIDPPDLGDSAKPAPAYDIKSIAANIWAAIDSLGLGSIDFVGFDLGMWIGYPLAMAQPQHVRTLTLIDAVIPGLVPWPPFSPPAANCTWHFAFNMLPELPELLIEGRKREFLAWLFRSRTPTPGVFNDADLDEFARVYRGRAAITSAVGYYRAQPATMQQVGELMQAGILTMPVLAVAGSAGVGPSIVEAVKRIAPHATGLVVDGCGHYVSEEAPGALLVALDRLLSQ
ncbi:MAG: alpha/beta hydrolase [Betaproteobacteria bacterium]|nr:alpha/beta hydrolase [Betaproteobacteria bacterium]